jgi:RNA polymerase sigma-70 factor (sigma-E family)
MGETGRHEFDDLTFAGLTFDDYVAANGAGLERYAFVLSGDSATAEDLVQTALMKALRRWRRISRMEFPDAYVRRVVTTTYLDLRRHRAGREQPWSVIPERPGGRDPAAAVADRDQLTRALRTLTAQQRAVMVLRHYLGLDDAAIATELGCGEATVRSHASRALQRMREFLTDTELQELP